MSHRLKMSIVARIDKTIECLFDMAPGDHDKGVPWPAVMEVIAWRGVISTKDLRDHLMTILRGKGCQRRRYDGRWHFEGWKPPAGGDLWVTGLEFKLNAVQSSDWTEGLRLSRWTNPSARPLLSKALALNKPGVRAKSSGLLNLAICSDPHIRKRLNELRAAAMLQL